MEFGSLALVLAAGLLGPALAGAPRLGLPLVVGELLAGIAIGKTGAGWIHPGDAQLKFLGEVGFAVLMLVAGTHLPVHTPGLTKALRKGAVAVAVAAAVAIPLALLLDHVTPLHKSGIFVLLLSTSSAAIVMPVLGEGAASAETLVAVAWVALADIATVVAIPIVLAKGHVAKVVVGSLLVTAAAGVLFLAIREAQRRDVFDGPARLSLQRGWALRLRLSLVALFTLAWIATSFGTSVLVAGFSIGAVIAVIGEPRETARELIGIGEGFLIPVFFVTLGARLDVRALFSDPKNLGLLAALVGGILVVHVVVALVIRAGVATGLLASAQLGVPAAITTIGLANGSLKPGQGAAVVTAAIVSVGVAAYGARLVTRRPAAVTR